MSGRACWREHWLLGVLSVSGLFTVVVNSGGASPADGTVALFLDHFHVPPSELFPSTALNCSGVFSVPG